MIYYISDLHIGHNNVIGFDNRPFKNTDEMFKTIVSNWNSIVKDGDTVYILGDFLWKKRQPDEWIDIVGQLKGNKVLIRGNHDPKGFAKGVRDLFVDIRDYLEIQDGEYNVILCHYPILCFNHDYFPKTVMIYGHVHNTEEMNFVQEYRKSVWKHRELPNGEWTFGHLGQLLHAGCMEEYMNYTPRTLSQIIQGDIEKYGNPIKNIKIKENSR